MNEKKFARQWHPLWDEGTERPADGFIRSYPLYPTTDDTPSHLNMPERIHVRSWDIVSAADLEHGIHWSQADKIFLKPLIEKYGNVLDIRQMLSEDIEVPRAENFAFEPTSRESFLQWRNAPSENDLKPSPIYKKLLEFGEKHFGFKPATLHVRGESTSNMEREVWDGC